MTEQPIEKVMASMKPETRDLCEASGKVSDDRRLVAFLYLMMLEHVPVGAVAQVLRDTVSLEPTKRAAVRQGHTAIAHKLTDSRGVRIEDFIALLFKLYTITPTAAQLILQRIPAADDVTTVFTNGWVARYAQHVADQLIAEDGETA